MPAKHNFPLRFRFFGNVEKAQELTGQARKYMGFLYEFMAFNKLPTHVQEYRDAEGNIYRCMSNQTGLAAIDEVQITAMGGGELDVLRGFIVRLKAPNNWDWNTLRGNAPAMWLKVVPVEDDAKYKKEGKTDFGYTLNEIRVSDVPYSATWEVNGGWANIDMETEALPFAKDGEYYIYDYHSLYDQDGEVSEIECYAGRVSKTATFDAIDFIQYAPAHGGVPAYIPSYTMLNQNGNWELGTTTLYHADGTSYTQYYAKFVGTNNDGVYWNSALYSASEVSQIFRTYNKYLATLALPSLPSGYVGITTSDVVAYFDAYFGTNHHYIMPAFTYQRAEPATKIRYVKGDYKYESGAIVYQDRYTETDSQTQLCFAAVMPGKQKYQASAGAKAPQDSIFNGPQGPISLDLWFTRVDAPEFDYLTVLGGVEKDLYYPQKDKALYLVDYMLNYGLSYPEAWFMDSGNVNGTYEVSIVCDSTNTLNEIEFELDFLLFGTKTGNVFRYKEKIDLTSRQWQNSNKKIVLNVGKPAELINNINPHIRIESNK